MAARNRLTDNTVAPPAKTQCAGQAAGGQPRRPGTIAGLSERGAGTAKSRSSGKSPAILPGSFRRFSTACAVQDKMAELESRSSARGSLRQNWGGARTRRILEAPEERLGPELPVCDRAGADGDEVALTVLHGPPQIVRDDAQVRRVFGGHKRQQRQIERVNAERDKVVTERSKHHVRSEAQRQRSLKP
jgi:hypothetical protein